MKTYDEYMDNIRRKAGKIKKRRRIALSATCACLTLVLCLSVQAMGLGDQVTPEPVGSTNVAQGNTYAVLAEKVSQGLEYRDIATDSTDSDATQTSSNLYVEVTDNQVDGVIEADCFKRSDKYLYYLNEDGLKIFSIQGLDSREVGSFDHAALLEQYGLATPYTGGELFLSEDCNTVTMICQGWRYEKEFYGAAYYTAVISLDVSDPANVQLKNVLFFTGWNASARMVDGDILLTYAYFVNENKMDPEDPTTYVPSYGNVSEMVAMDANDVFCPTEGAQSRYYQVVARLDGDSLELRGMVALMGCSNSSYVAYVSPTTVYLVGQYTVADGNIRHRASQILGVSYEGEGLQMVGEISLLAEVNDQYSMDEYQGTLRLAATAVQRQYEEVVEGDKTDHTLVSTQKDCVLYVVDLSSWQVAASVQGFAPVDEEVVSARFDGDTAYICTAELEEYTDPVYCFDLSDLSNISYKQSPVLEGYSSALTGFGDCLLGIGPTDATHIKLELFRQTEDAMESVTAYVQRWAICLDYKCIYVDAEQGMVGFAIDDLETTDKEYVLLQFDGEQFNIVQRIPITLGGTSRYIRGTVIDGILYVMDGQLHTVALDQE